MDKNSNSYTFIFSIVMVVVVAVVLSLIATQLQPRQEQNMRIEKKRNILSAINVQSTARDVADIFDNYIAKNYAVNIEGIIIDDVDAFEIEVRDEIRRAPEEIVLPVFEAQMPDNSVKYIFAFHGRGLWGPLWGYISFYEDMNTVYGAYFSHQGETPGLGAEIETKSFQEQFIGKKIFNEDNEFVSIDVVKGGARNEYHEVDALSGGTITCNGLSDMIYDVLNLYMGYIRNMQETK